MSNFKIIKKGYSQLEVDSYIERLVYDYESRLAEQKERILREHLLLLSVFFKIIMKSLKKNLGNQSY